MKHQYSIDELKHRENLMQARLEDEQARREELEEHKVKAARRGPTAPPAPPRPTSPVLRQVHEGWQGPGPKNLSFN